MIFVRPLSGGSKERGKYGFITGDSISADFINLIFSEEDLNFNKNLRPGVKWRPLSVAFSHIPHNSLPFEFKNEMGDIWGTNPFVHGKIYLPDYIVGIIEGVTMLHPRFIGSIYVGASNLDWQCNDPFYY